MERTLKKRLRHQYERGLRLAEEYHEFDPAEETFASIRRVVENYLDMHTRLVPAFLRVKQQNSDDLLSNIIGDPDNTTDVRISMINTTLVMGTIHRNLESAEDEAVASMCEPQRTQKQTIRILTMIARVAEKNNIDVSLPVLRILNA